jgi:exosortase/archaeosortase family protein
MPGLHGARRNGRVAESAHASHRASPYRPVLRFVAIFLIALTFFAILFSLGSVRESIIPPHLAFVAGICGNILNMIGLPVTVTGATIWSDRISLVVVEGCDSVYPTSLLWCALLALPVPVSRRLAGMVVGALLLFALNILRVTSMYVVGIMVPSLFAAMHLYVWQGLFILCTLGLFLSMARYGRAARASS